jgi:zinc protease
VVAGDVSTEEVKRLSEKWFGDIPARPLKKHPLPQEPRQRKARFMEKKGDVPFIGVYKMFHIPAHTTQEFYVMDMITDLLSNGKTGKLFQDLVQTQSLANSISAFTWGMAEPGALSINAQLSDGVSTAAYEAALAVCIGELQDLTEEDLVRIKNKLQSSFLVEKMHLLNKAMGLAFADYLGNVDLVNQTAQIYQSITLQQIKKAAARYLVASNSSTLYYLPK